jgi:translation initiation factor 2B subunit (eIF-2B alpha/beta/delta family)
MPPSVEEKVAEMESLEVLGATRQLSIVADALVMLAEQHEGGPEDLARDARRLSDYLISTRGQSSQAIGNALKLMLEGLEERAELSRTPGNLSEWLVQQVRAYEAASQNWIRNLTEHGTNLLSSCRRVLAYDYSSSVAAILRSADEWEGQLEVVVPESRILDGGAKYLSDLQDTKLRLDFVPDSALGVTVRDCDLVLEGAETLSAEGGCYNTVGTFLAALAARYWRKPFYVASALIKIDAGTVRGNQRPVPIVDLRESLFGDRFAHFGPRVRASCPDLDYTPPDLITGFITEEGILPPSAIWQHAARFAGKEDARNDA